MHYNYNSAIFIMKRELGTERAQTRVMFSGDSFGIELTHNFE